MKYYKIIIDDKIVGAVSSTNFIKYSPITESFLRSNENNGEFVNWKSKIYRDTWMQPVPFTIDFIQALILNITEEEYNILSEAFITNDEIEYEREEQEEYIEPEYIDPIDVNTIEFVRTSKIQEMSSACRAAIESGFNLNLRGETHHFSLTTQDQLNIMNLSILVQTQELIPYHADGEETTFYTAEEINQIIAAATQFKTYQTTYYNALKTYINALDTIEDIAAITYGTPIPEEYKSDVLKVLE